LVADSLVEEDSLVGNLVEEGILVVEVDILDFVDKGHSLEGILVEVDILDFVDKEGEVPDWKSIRLFLINKIKDIHLNNKDTLLNKVTNKAILLNKAISNQQL